MKKYLILVVSALALMVGIASAVTSGTWLCPGTGRTVDISVAPDGRSVTITHNGASITVPSLPGSRPGTAAEFPSPPNGAGAEVGGASFRGSYPAGTPKWSEEPQGRPWFSMPRMSPKEGSSQSQGDGEGTLPMGQGS